MTVLNDFFRGRITYWTDRLAAASLIVEHLEDTEGVDAFKFDSGEAASSASYIKYHAAVDVVSKSEANILHYTGKINRTGIVRHNLRRR